MSTYERNANRLTIILLVALTLSAIIGAISLPDSIPLHFNGHGKPNRWGHPVNLLILPIISGGINGFMWAAQRYTPTYLMNIPGPRTPDNIAIQRQNFNQFFATIRALTTGLFLSIIVQISWDVNYLKGHLTLWPSYLFMILVSVSVVIYMIRAYRLIPRQ